MISPAFHEESVRNALREVIDPELGCNIVDLGLIYGIQIEGVDVSVLMTLTTPGCPMHESIARGVAAAIQQLPGVETVDVQLVWDPPWTPEKMTDAGRRALGITG
ncbi:MAG: metal-sulfur cluster assembly factor [Limisphaerales bacterium]